MSSKKYNLLVIAHPDDESIFFAGLLLRRKSRPWKIVCVTDANADGMGAMRRRQFTRATRLLGVRDIEWWGYPDIFKKRLPLDNLIARLRGLDQPLEIFTHGIIGEYLHPHHQDVSFCVHEAFSAGTSAGHSRVYSCSYNTYPDLQIKLTRREFALKARILTDIYGSETTRFLNLLPATFVEGFVKVGAREVAAVYSFLTKKSKTLNKKDLRSYKWLASYLKTEPMKKRLF